MQRKYFGLCEITLNYAWLIRNTENINWINWPCFQKIIFTLRNRLAWKFICPLTNTFINTLSGPEWTCLWWRRMTGNSNENTLTTPTIFGRLPQRGPRRLRMSMELHFRSRYYITESKCSRRFRLHGSIMRTLLSRTSVGGCGSQSSK